MWSRVGKTKIVLDDMKEILTRKSVSVTVRKKEWYYSGVQCQYCIMLVTLGQYSYETELGSSRDVVFKKNIMYILVAQTNNFSEMLLNITRLGSMRNKII